jgi:hypothetical protein
MNAKPLHTRQHHEQLQLNEEPYKTKRNEQTNDFQLLKEKQSNVLLYKKISSLHKLILFQSYLEAELTK